jgi:GT2 family glycosyltransferase
MGKGEHTVSVVICAHTLERWKDIREAIYSVRNQVLAPHEIVVVIDHNPELLQRTKAEYPDAVVTANREARGLSGGRNTGIAVSSGSLVAFLDDDAIADPHWLSGLVRHFGNSDILGVTARVEPLWIGVRPGWLPEEFLWTIGCSYRGLPTVPQEVRNVFGGAMIMKREVFERVGGFAAGLGRQGTRLPLSCEDTEICIRAKTKVPGGRFMLEPASIIWHKVPSARLTWRYFRSRCYAEGLSKGYLAALFKGQDVLGTERQHVLHTLSRGFVRGLADALFRFDPDGLKRVAAILLGVTSAGAGLLTARFLRLPPQFQDTAESLAARVNRSDA